MEKYFITSFEVWRNKQVL